MTPASRSIHQILEHRAESSGDEIGLIDKMVRWTYAEYNERVGRIGALLLESGVHCGDRVLVCANNSARTAACILGAMRAGAACVPLDPEVPAGRLRHVIMDCQPRAVIVDSDGAKKLRASGWSEAIDLDLCEGKSEWLDEGLHRKSMWRDLQAVTAMSAPDKDETKNIGALIYTSGSTAEPKGVVEPHGCIGFATEAINAAIDNRADDTILCGIPFSFDYGLYQIFLAIHCGATLAVAKKFNVPMAIPTLLHKYGVTGFPAVPNLLAMLIKSGLLERVALPRLRYITSTGDVLSIALVQRLRKLLPHVRIYSMYGLTECKRVSVLPSEMIDDEPGSAGLPLAGTSVWIRGEDGQPVAVGQVGELVVQGPHVMDGYWGGVSDNSVRFGEDTSGNGRILYTGDSFAIDDRGLLFFKGRRSGFLKVLGERVSVAEIERFVCSLDGVAAAAVVGVPEPTLGHLICVFVVPDSNTSLTDQAILQTCKRELPNAMRPRLVFVTENPLPTTPHGKIDRKVLVKRAKFLVEDAAILEGDN